MQRRRCKPAFGSVSWRTIPKGRRVNPINQIIMLILIIGTSIPANASVTCKGHFVNPITDVCWGCLLPISIGGLSIGKGGSPKKRDIKNPSSPVCACSKKSINILVF